MGTPRLAASPRDIPPVGQLVQHPAFAPLLKSCPRVTVVAAIRAVLQGYRALPPPAGGLEPKALALRVADHVTRLRARTLRPAINATGIVIHTGLGRSRLSEAAAASIREVALSHTLLEVDPVTGDRGSRQHHVRGLLMELTGAEDAAVVNNNAAAVLLAVAVLARDREVVISRGELVEIGGGFRLPEIIAAGGGKLVEVGTTNRTRVVDYARAISPDTALVLRCHPSNYRIVGFTESVDVQTLAGLCRERGVPLVDDVGSGALVHMPEGVLSLGPTLADSIRGGASVVTASGDKLLGGPQAGLVLGRRELVQQMMTAPMARALRPDKLTLCALEATLRHYLDGTALDAIPTLSSLGRSVSEIRGMAMRVLRAVCRHCPGIIAPRLEAASSQVGGGALPGEEIPTVCVRLQSPTKGASALADALRNGDPPVFGRVSAGAVLLDMRTVAEREIQPLARAIVRVLAEGVND